MIQLYSPSNTNYKYNGDFVLHPIRCDLIIELNGPWSLELEHVLDDSMNSLVENAVICVDTPIGEKQLFRIYEKEKGLNTVIVYARPIFLDSANDCFIWDIRPTNKTGQQALDLLTAGTKYKGHSNITKLSTAYYINKNLIEAIASDEDNSFINRWGGEVLYKNYDVYINHQVGQDRGMRVEFGFNLTGLKETVNMDNVVTRIVPKAYNGYILPNKETIDSTNIKKYPVIYTRVIEYPDVKLQEDCGEDEQGCKNLTELYALLRKKAKEEYTVHAIDLPQITYEVSMVDLSKTTLYKDYKNLMLVSLGDTVHCKHRRLDIETNARVIKIDYDCITNSINELTLGDYTQSYFDKLSSVYNAASNVIDLNSNTVMADKIYGILNAMNTQLKYQKDVAKKQDVRAILFEDLDIKSPTYGAMCIGSLGWQIAKKRTADGTDWDWTTAATANGIVADVISAGILQGIKLIGNTITNGNNFSVDANGNMVAKNAKFSGSITGSDININNTFTVSKEGNMVAKSGKFSGSITGSDININDIFTVSKEGKLVAKDAEIKGKIIGGSISGNTTIKVGTDLYVGNNIYLGDQDNTIRKIIYLNKDNYIQLSSIMTTWKSENLSINMHRNVFSFFEGEDKPILTMRTQDNEIIFFMDCSVLANLYVSRDVDIVGSLSVTGKKNRCVKTVFGDICLNAVESASCYFTDEGQTMLDKDGRATINFDCIWLETVNTNEPYHIQLTPHSEVCPWIVKEEKDSFTISGKPNTKVNWHISALQRDYENTRLEIKKGSKVNKRDSKNINTT